MKESTIAQLKDNSLWFDIIQTSGSSTPVEFKNGNLYSVKERQNSGTGLRVNCGGKTGFAYTNGTDFDETAQAARALAKYGEDEGFSLPQKGADYPQCRGFTAAEFDTAGEIEKGRELAAKIKDRYPHAETDITLSGGNGKRTLTNSNGLSLEESFCHYSASASVTLAEEEGRTEVWSAFSADKSGALDLIEREIFWRLDNSVRKASVSSAKIPVLLSAQGVLSFLDILLGGLDARSIYRGISPYCGKIGSQMFHPSLNILDNPLLEESPHRYSFDDEGVPAEKKYLIRNGVPETVIADLKYAWLLNGKPTGNASRGYSSLPAPSFSCIELLPGSRSFNEILASVKKGILVDSMIGLGQSNTVTGDFSANIDLGFLIDNGELCGRVKDCMISGNIFDIFSKSLEAASDPFFAGGSRVPGILLESVDITSR